MKKYIRMLVFQNTNHVIWYDDKSFLGQPKRVPNISKDLDYRIFNSELTEDKWEKEFLKFRLKKGNDYYSLEYGDVPSEFYYKFKLLRKKCYIMENIINGSSFMKEKLNLINDPLLNDNLNKDELINVFSETFKITQIESKKLIDFKKNEVLFWTQKIDLDQIKFQLALEKASSFEELKEIENNLNLNFVMGRPTFIQL
jgi:hypothetical protein